MTGGLGAQGAFFLFDVWVMSAFHLHHYTTQCNSGGQSSNSQKLLHDRTGYSSEFHESSASVTHGKKLDLNSDGVISSEEAR